MITEMSRAKLIDLGARFRADPLIEQACYTLGFAALENAGLANLLHAFDGGTPTIPGARRRVPVSAATRTLAKHERPRQARLLPLHGDGDRRRLTSAWTLHSRLGRIWDPSVRA